MSSTAAARLVALDLPGNVFLGRVLTDAPRRLASGSAVIDVALGGGWPRGRLSELVGPVSSGRTALLLALLSAATRRGEVVGYVDVADALDPASLARAGAELERVLWVRPPSLPAALRCTELILQAGGFSAVAVDFGAALPRGLRALVWPRLARASERSHSALIVAAPQRLAGSFATISVGVHARRCCWSDGLWPLFDGLTMAATVTRTKLGAPGANATLELCAVPSCPLSRITAGEG